MTVAAVPVDFPAVAIGLFGGLALFLYGMKEMSDGLKSAAGESLKTLMERLTSNRFTAAVTGAVLTAVIQSSSVTTVLLVGFVNAGLMSLQQAAGVIMGANAGTTITGQIAAFRVTEYSWAMILVGYVLATFVRGGTLRHYGTMLLGLGLLFLGMEQMSDATEPLRTFDPFIQLMQRMDNRLLGIMAGAAFTALVQSSSATTGIVITLAGSGFLSLEAGIALTIGANIGTCFTAVLSTIGKSPVAIRTAVVHVVFNIAGALIWLGFIDPLADMARQLSPSADQLEGVARLAVETPRQIANANTIFNVANTLILIWLVGPITRLAVWLVPEKPVAEAKTVTPEFLDPVYLETPSLAFDRVRREIEHLSRRVLEMLDEIPELPNGSTDHLSRLQERGREVAELRLAILSYLRALDISELSDSEAVQMERCLSAVVHVAGAAELISTHVVGIGRQYQQHQVQMSEATAEELQPLYAGVRRALASAAAAFCQSDAEQAAAVMAQLPELQALTRQVMEHLAERITSSDPERAILFSLETELVSHLKSLCSIAEDIAELAE